MRIVTDNVADISPELIEKYNIAIAPINIAFGNEEFISGYKLTDDNMFGVKPITHEEFYAKTEKVTDANFPKTSQTTPYQFVQMYEKMIAEGETDILTITVTKKVSGTYASALAAQKEMEGKANIHLMDSEAGGGTQAFMVLEAARLAAEGVDVETIKKEIAKMRDETTTIFFIDRLDYAVKSGRVAAWRSTLASMLNIKPIMKLDDGAIVEEAKVRTPKKAMKFMVDYAKERIGDKPAIVKIAAAASTDNAMKLKAMVEADINVVEFTLIDDMNIPIAINMGPGAVALFVRPQK